MNFERVYKLLCGDLFYTTDVDNNMKVGQQYKNYPTIICRVDYKPRKWYHFWKKKEISGVCVQWLGDE